MRGRRSDTGEKVSTRNPNNERYWDVLVAASVIMKSGEHAVTAFSR